MSLDDEYSYAILEPDGGPKVLDIFQQRFKESNSMESSVLNEYEKALIERIRDAFDGVRLEDGIGLMQAEAEDDYAIKEVQDYLAQHEERENWSNLTVNQLNTCPSALSYVDAKGFRFLIPAFVIHDIMDQLQSANPYYSLTYNLHEDSVSASFHDYDRKQMIDDKCSQLSEDQKNVLQEYIRYYRARNDEYYTSLWDTQEDIKQREDHEKKEASSFSQEVPQAKNWIRHDFLVSDSVKETLVNAVDNDQNQWLLRIIPGLLDQSTENEFQEKLSRKQKEIRIHAKLAQAGIPLPFITETGKYGSSERIYILQPWIQGTVLKYRDFEKNTQTNQDCYNLGLEAGKILKSIHSVPVLPPDTIFSDDLIRKEFKQWTHEQNGEDNPAHEQEKAFEYVRSNMSQLSHSPAIFLHGNYKTDNIILKCNGQLAITNLKSWNVGDGARDFSAMLLYKPFYDSNQAISFARGQIDGYCDHRPTDDFFRRIAFYTAFHLCFYHQIEATRNAFVSYDSEWLTLTYKEWESYIPSWYHGKVH